MMQQLNKAGILLNSLEICPILQWYDSSVTEPAYILLQTTLKKCVLFMLQNLGTGQKCSLRSL